VGLDREGAPVCEGSPRYSFGHVLARADPDKPDGIFCDWSWDGETLRARVDRYAVAPLFYARVANGVMLAPSLADLVARGASTDLDFDALAVLLRFGQPLDEDTPFAAIRAMPPAGRLVWRAGKLTVESRYPDIPPRSFSRAAAIEGYIELFRAAIARRPASGRLVLPLSGGRDSRHIFLELCRQERPPDACVTSTGFADAAMTDDVSVAGQLCRAVSMPHHVIGAPANPIDATIAVDIETNLAGSEHGWTGTLATFLAAHADVTYDGLAGDVLSAGHLFTDQRLAALVGGDANGLADSIFVSGEYGLHLVLPPRLYRDLSRERAVARLAQALPRHLAAANPLQSFMFWSRTRRNVAQVPFAMFGGVKTVYAPYLDWDLFDFFSSLGPELTRDKLLHTEAIAHAYPDFSQIHYSAGWQDVGARALERHYRQQVGALAMRFIRGDGSSLVNRPGLLPRMAWAVLSGSAGTTAPSYLKLACYLTALDAVRSEGAN